MTTPLPNMTIFLDRDGTLNYDTGYVTSPEQLTLLPGVVESVARLKQSGSRLVLVTNQSAIARGYMKVDDLHLIHQKLEDELEAGGGGLDGIFFCPHHPEDACACRKPSPGLIHQAVKELQVNAAQSYLVGDKHIDMVLAQSVGSIGVLVMTSEFSQDALKAIDRQQGHQVGYVASTFSEAADWILNDAQKRTWI